MSIRELYELQELDWARAEKGRVLDEVRSELADDSNLSRARLLLSRLQAQHTTESALRRDAQLIVEQIEAREQAVENRLYSGAVTNPRELEAFQEEQATLGRQKAEAEDVLLERMVAVEELEESLDETRSALSAMEERRQARVPQLQEQERALSAELDALERRRSELLPQFDGVTLSTYETLLASRGGHAVSKVEASRGNDICGACRVALPRSDAQRVRSGDTLVQCNNCRRILYLE